MTLILHDTVVIISLKVHLVTLAFAICALLRLDEKSLLNCDYEPRAGDGGKATTENFKEITVKDQKCNQNLNKRSNKS